MSNSDKILQKPAQSGIDSLSDPHPTMSGTKEGNNDAEWQKLNILTLDGAGVRTYWSVLALDKLIEYIALEEEQDEIYHSFYPQPWPDELSYSHFTPHETRGIKRARSREDVLSLPRQQRYLLCHYFDLICGSGTGSFVAIMAGRLRMTIRDCVIEYEYLQRQMFGRPRMLSTLRFGLGIRYKYSALSLEHAFKEIVNRHAEDSDLMEHRKTRFSSRIGLCRTLVPTEITSDGDRSSTLYLIRSYDNDGNTLPDDPTKKMAMSAGYLARKGRDVNYGKAEYIEIWQVARAATAMPMYFEPLKIRMLDECDTSKTISLRTRDILNPNPTAEAVREVQELYGSTAVGVVVSVGTANKKPQKLQTRSSRLKSRESFKSLLNDTGAVHRTMQQDAVREGWFSYYRLDDPDGLQVGFDDLQPRQSRLGKDNDKCGSLTLATIKNAFNKWASMPETVEQLQSCASALVACRKKRMSTTKWERYATGAWFKCRYRGCFIGDFLERGKFREHLSRTHNMEDEEMLDEEVRQRRSYWRYQAHGTADQDHEVNTPNTPVTRPTGIPESEQDEAIPEVQAEESKRHILDPHAYFSELENLEVDVAIDCRVKDLFPDVREGICQSVDLDMAYLDGFSGLPQPHEPVPYRVGIPAALIASQSLMTGVLRAYNRLHDNKFCANGVKFLVASRNRPLVAEIVSISNGILENISHLLDEAIIDLREHANGLEETANTVETASQWTLDYLGLSSLSSTKPEALQNTKNLIQLLCIGVTSYSGSHASEFHRSCLDLSTPVAFKIGPSGVQDGVITLQQEKLSCLDEFVGGSVWVFSSSSEVLHNSSRSHDEANMAVSTSIEDLADLWGPAWTTESDFHLINHIDVERGVIYQPRVLPFKYREQLRHDEVACHWRSWNGTEDIDAVPFNRHARLLIGFDRDAEGSEFGDNPTCSKLSSQLYTKLTSENEEIVLNTDRERYLLEMQSLSLSVSRIVGGAYTAGFKRIPARTLKAMLILDWSDETPSVGGLDALLGLEISACTGNARRVKLWEIIKVQAIQDFIEVTMVDQLPNYVLISGFWDAFRKDFNTFKAKWEADTTFRTAARHVIRKILQKLNDTGIDRDKQLRAWWPDGKAHRAFRFKPDRHKWVRMLHESPSTAVFAIISTNCLQYLDRYGIACSSKAQDKGRTVLRTAVKLDRDMERTDRPRARTTPNLQNSRTKTNSMLTRSVGDVASVTDNNAQSAAQELEAKLSRLRGAVRKGKTRENNVRNIETKFSTTKYPIRDHGTSRPPPSSQVLGEPSERKGHKCSRAECRHETPKTHMDKGKSNDGPRNENGQPYKSVFKEGETIQLLGQGQLVIHTTNRPQRAEWKARGAKGALEERMHAIRNISRPQHRELLHDDIESNLIYHLAVM